MKFSIRYADKIVGTLVVLALIILIVVIFTLGNSQRWFARDIEYKTYFTSASALSVNMAVRYKGFTIGHVKRVRLSDDDKVEVTFTIFEEYSDRVREGSLVEIRESPIGLGNSFIFHPGRGVQLIEEGSFIPEITSIEAKWLIASGQTALPETDGDPINSIINQVMEIIEAINVAIIGSDETDGSPLEHILKNIETATARVNTQLSPIMDNLETLTGQISDPSGAVMSILSSDGPVYTELTSVISSIAGTIENLEKTSDFIPAQLPQVAIMINDLDIALRSAQDVLTAVSNLPFIRSNVPQRVESGPGGTTPRDLEF
ncbi:MAG: MlaD family protein [Treponema sp.]|jgi:phospholipid/cholesterol/gamma-HCH transport system substrate-binding protein|nr:MlaD family protein [Treponema sp.]